MIIITGASDGLGKAVARLYKEAGKKVVNISRRECEYAEVNICLSLREGPEIAEAAQKVLALDEPIEAIINSIGVYGQNPFGKITEDEIKLMMSTNVKAPMLLVSHLIERLKKDESDILNVISTAGIAGKAEEPVYAASKWAERGYTKSLQESLRGTPCRVISFCPGGMRTELFLKSGKDVNNSQWMRTEDMAVLVKNILDLPKNMEVSEIVINRK